MQLNQFFLRRKSLGGLCALVLAAAALLAGCGVGSGGKVRDVSVTVSRGFGGQIVQQADFSQLAQSDTVIRALQRKFEVTTSFGGRMVKSINGISAGKENDQPVDWFFYVNGVESQVGAAERHLTSNDHVWWDHHPWKAAVHVPAIVGSFPEPFKSGLEGKRLPVRIDCSAHAGRACDEVVKRLEEAKVFQVAKASLGQASGEYILRIVVGPWSEVRLDPAARQIERGPQASGVFARFDPSGARLQLLDSHGGVAQTLGAGGALIAATRFHEQAPTWVVTGTDEVGAEAAASALIEAKLANHFALAIDRGIPIGLPMQSSTAPLTSS